MDKRLHDLKREYKKISIPAELDSVVKTALKKKTRKKPLYAWPLSAAAAAVLFTGVVNASPEAAHAMAKIPVLKSIVEVITFNEMKEQTDTTDIDVKTPSISGLENKSLEANLNKKYLQESKELYKEFKERAVSKEEKGGHFALYSDYKVVTDTPDILSVLRHTERIQASGYTEKRYVTIDKKNEVLLTLRSLFKDDRYIRVISANIQEQMKKQMKADPNIIYWLADDEIEPFTAIKPDQPFYITSGHKLVILFDEYEAAPGYMGAVEFEIPTEAISGLLVGDRYIK